MKYVREGDDLWHISVPDIATGLTLCRRFPTEHWDQEAGARPPEDLCSHCEESLARDGEPLIQPNA